MNSDINLLIKAKEAYYNTGHPIITDKEYDALEERAIKKDPNHPLFETVGHPPSPSWEKESHSISMGSLNKVHSKEEIIKWSERFDDKTILTLQFKLDGLSVSLDYDIEFINGITRGNGLIGEVISDNVRLMKGFKDILPGFTGSIRGEIILPKADFERINEALSEEDKYSNPRNAASGISRRLDGKYCKYLQIIVYDITGKMDEDEKITILHKKGLTAVKQVIGSIDKIITAFEELEKVRAKLPIDIDGAVVKVNSYRTQQEHGISSKRPKAQIAWKFDAPGAATIFEKEVWDVGRTGVVTPLAHLEPVDIEGSTIKRATLHNVAEIKRLGIGRGDMVMIEKRGDIIPKITSVIQHKGSPIEIPTKCPSCESELVNNDTQLFCLSQECPQKIFYKIMNWIRVTGIEEFGESLGKELQDSVKCIADLYNLKETHISSLPRWGDKSAKTVIDNINETRKLKPEVFLTAIGIPGISERTSEELLKAFGSIEELMKVNVEAITDLKGFADTSAAAIISGLTQHNDEIEQLLKIINVSTDEEKEGILFGKSFCFTGTMTHPRPYYQKLVEKHGGKNGKSVTKDLTFLVCNEDKGSSKSQKAEKYGVKVINADGFMKMVGEVELEPEGPKKPKIESFSLFD